MFRCGFAALLYDARFAQKGLGAFDVVQRREFHVGADRLASDGGQIIFINPGTPPTDRYFTNLREVIRRRAMLKGVTLIADRLTRQPPIRYHKAGPRRPHAPGAQARANRLIENGVDSGVVWRRDDGAVDHRSDMFAKGIVVHSLY